MAEKHVSSATRERAGGAAPSERQMEGAEGLHKFALGLLKDRDDEQAKIFAVAAAGSKYIHEESDTAGYLFNVIQQFAEDASVSNDLRHAINRLAQLAGSKLAPEEAEVDHA